VGESVFINYRRGEDQAAAGRLYDQLEAAFTRDRIFIDVDNIPPGRDFTEELSSRVAQCDIFLAVVGRNWADVVDVDGGRRLDNPNDWVRVEIESAQRLGKHIIPVLVNGAEMPRPERLPESLQPFTRRNAARLTHERFRADVQALIAAIAKLREAARAEAKAQEAGAPAPRPAAAVAVAGRRLRPLAFSALAAFALFAAVTGFVAWRSASVPPTAAESPGARAVASAPASASASPTAAAAAAPEASTPLPARSPASETTVPEPSPTPAASLETPAARAIKAKVVDAPSTPSAAPALASEATTPEPSPTPSAAPSPTPTAAASATSEAAIPSSSPTAEASPETPAARVAEAKAVEPPSTPLASPAPAGAAAAASPTPSAAPTSTPTALPVIASEPATPAPSPVATANPPAPAAGAGKIKLAEAPSTPPAASSSPAVVAPSATPSPQAAAATPEVQAALASPPAESAVKPSKADAVATPLIVAELRRLGCYGGAAIEWGDVDVRIAVFKFAQMVKLAAVPTEPDVGLLAALKSEPDHFCAPQCSPREVASDGRCVPKTCGANEILTNAGACVARPAAPKPRATAAARAAPAAGKHCFTFNGSSYCE